MNFDEIKKNYIKNCDDIKKVKDKNNIKRTTNS